jgi:hypothetical protein
LKPDRSRWRWPGADLVHFETQPSARSLRGFGFVALGVFGWLGYVAGSGGDALAHAAGVSLAALGAIAALCSLLRPRWNRPLYLALSALSYPIAWLLAWVLLIAVFSLVVTPSALFYRAFVRRRAAPAQSAWHPARETRDKASYFRQF